MCDLDIGDEVVRVAHAGDAAGAPPVGWVGRVTYIEPECDPKWPGVTGIMIDTWPMPPGLLHNAECWRKVERPNPHAALRSRATSKPRELANA